MKGYLGIDVSKGYSDFVLLDDTGHKMEDTFQLDDTRFGHNHLKEYVQDLLSKRGFSSLYCGLESTGGYEDNWFSMLIGLSAELPVQVARLNPGSVKDAARAERNSNITDSESARNIANFLRRYQDQIDYKTQDKKYVAFRSLHNHIVLLTKQRSQLINELKHVLYGGFPELQRFCKQSIPTWVLELLIQYPSHLKLARASAEKVSRIKGITLDKAGILIEKAKESVSSRNSPTDEFLIKNTCKDIKVRSEQIDELKDYLINNCKGPETKLLESMKGIASYSAAAIMVHIEDVNRFPSPKKLASFFGLHPSIKESGDKSRKSHITKKGRPAMRSILYMCAHTGVLHDQHMKAIYARHRATGKSHKEAVCVVMHKMLRVIWGLLKSGTTYNSEVDATNQQKSTPPVTLMKEREMKTKRRFQEFDHDAPISRIAHKKRKVQTESQVGSAEHVRDLLSEPKV